MKKRLIGTAKIGLLALTIFTLIAGCGKSSTDSKTTKTDSTSIETSETSETIDDNLIKVKQRGIQYDLSEEFQARDNISLARYGTNQKGYRFSSLIFYGQEALDILDIVQENKDISEEEMKVYEEKYNAAVRPLLEIVMVETDEYDKEIASGKTPEDFTTYSPAEEFGVNDGYTYIVSIPDVDNGSLTEDEIKDYQACKEYMQEVKKNLTFVPVELEKTETELGEKMVSFSSTDIYGQPVTSELFSKNKLTIVNVWGTFCSPCIGEMPELESWSKELPEGVQIIGIVGDIENKNDTKHLEEAKIIVESAKVTFTNIVPNDEIKPLLDGVIAYPTTFLVDSTGTIVGEPVMGAYMDLYKEAVEAYLSGK